MIKIIALGTDPEVFIRDTHKEEFVSSEGLIGGSKKEPRVISERGHALQEDNVMVEFNIPPCVDHESFSREIDFTLDHINRELENINPHYQVMVVASARFNKEQLNTEQALTVGCDPDRNAWWNMDNPIPNLPEDRRFAGGHIHISYENPNEETNIKIVKAMDMFLGLPAVIMDVDDYRKEIYGTPGRYRNKSFGVEYRSLSNFWISSPQMIEWVFNQVNAAINFINAGKEVPEEVAIYMDTNNKVKAREFCFENQIQIIENEFVNIDKNEYITRNI